jgi:hypothetical protein
MAIPGEKVMNQRGYSIGGVPFSAESMDYLSSVLPGLSDVVHYGGDQGLLTNFMDRPEAAFGAKANKAIAANIQARYPEATVTPAGVQSTYTDYNAPLDADWMPEEHRAAWRGGAAPGEPIREGTDRATNLMLSNLNDEQMRRLDNDQMKAAVRQKWQRDEDLAAQGKITVRPDVQTARKLFSEGGFDALKAAIGKGILPAAAAGIFLNEFMAPGEQAAPQRDQT